MSLFEIFVAHTSHSSCSNILEVPNYISEEKLVSLLEQSKKLTNSNLYHTPRSHLKIYNVYTIHADTRFYIPVRRNLLI